MKGSRLYLQLFIISLIFFSFIGIERIEGAHVIFIIGDVKIMRNGKVIVPQRGIQVKEGDILHVERDALIEMGINKSNERLKINGPNIFRYTACNLKEKIKHYSLIYSLLEKISKKVIHYTPITIVSAVRGEPDGRDVNSINRELKEKMKRLIMLFQENRLAEALTLLENIESSKLLRKHAKILLSYYRAEILFKRMEYGSALNIYKKIYKTRFLKFRHREEAHARAIVSAEYTGDYLLMRKLIQEYEGSYGKKGNYRALIGAIKRNGNNY